MKTVIDAIGVVFIITLLCIISSAAICFTVYFLDKYYEKKRSKIQFDSRIEVGSQLINLSYWFSEDTKVQELLESIARGLICNNAIPDAGGLRQTWRSK